MINVLIIQPKLRHYRFDLYCKISCLKNINLTVVSSTYNQITNQFSWHKNCGPTLSFFNILYWQKSLPYRLFFQTDIIVLSSNPRFISTIFVLLFCKICNIKTIWWGHYWSSTSTNFNLKLRKTFYILNDFVLFYSDKELSEYSKKHNCSSTMFGAINNGINIDRIKVLRRNYVSSLRSNNFVFIGRLSEKSKFNIIIEALSYMNIKPIIHVIGDGILRKHFMDQACKLGLSDYFIWYGTIHDEDSISDILNKCLAFVYPGAVGLSIIHSMAYGLPSIIHDNIKLHMPEVCAFKNDVTGLSFKYNDTTDLVKVFEVFQSKNVDTNSLSLNCINTIDNTYTTESMSKKFSSIFNNLYFNDIG